MPVADCHARNVLKQSSAPLRSGSSSTDRPSPTPRWSGGTRRARRPGRGRSAAPPMSRDQATRSGRPAGRVETGRSIGTVQGVAGFGRREHAEQQGDVGDGAAHRTLERQRVPRVARAEPGDDAWRRSEPDDVVPRRRVAQRAAHVAAVGDGDHAARQRRRGAAARPAGGPTEVPRVAGDAVQRVERVRPGPELGGVGLADGDRAGRLACGRRAGCRRADGTRRTAASRTSSGSRPSR